MRIVFIAPPSSGRYGRPSSPPVGLAYLATVSKNKGHDVMVLDLRVEPPGMDYMSRIKKFDPGLICVSFMSYGYKKSYRFLEDLKKGTGAAVMIGGAHTSVLRGKVLEECVADYAVYGEGEETLLEFLEGKSLSDIDGLIWRNGDCIVVNKPRQLNLDLDSLPFPEYDLFDMDKYAQERIPLNTARGCPHLCTYCAVDMVIGRRFRARTAPNVVDEIEKWYRKGYRNFGFNDSTFTENMKRSVEIADEIIKRGIEIEWDLRTGIRVDRVNEEVLTKLKQAGCTFIAFGIESIDKEVLALLKKGINYDQVKEAVSIAKKCGIGVGGFFMIGTPGDTYEKFRKSYEFADTDLFDEARFYNTEPYPGTELFEWIKENGRFLFSPEEYLNSRSRWEENPIFETDTFTMAERKKAFNEGEFLASKKLAIKILGKKLGMIVYIPCRIKILRYMILTWGFRMAPVIFKFLGRIRKIAPQSA